MTLTAFGASDIGRARARNEDAFVIRTDIGLFAVADGMGGHAAGDVASRTAIDALTAAMTIAADESLIPAAVRLANLSVWERGQAEAAVAGMGSTLTVLLFSEDHTHATIGHVGDTRCYLLRKGTLEQLTRDHTSAQDLVDQGQLAKEAARGHPYSSMLHRAIGTKEDVDVDIVTTDVQTGDLFLLCSDGLSGLIAEDDLHAMIAQEKPLNEIVADLIEAANLRGGTDNITAVLVRAD